MRYLAQPCSLRGHGLVTVVPMGEAFLAHTSHFRSFLGGVLAFVLVLLLCRIPVLPVLPVLSSMSLAQHDEDLEFAQSALHQSQCWISRCRIQSHRRILRVHNAGRWQQLLLCHCAFDMLFTPRTPRQFAVYPNYQLEPNSLQDTSQNKSARGRSLQLTAQKTNQCCRRTADRRLAVVAE